MRWLLALTLVGCAANSEPLARTEQPLSTSIVISQIYGGGGNMGTVYTSDFVELFNRGPTAVSVSGWSIQYASATGTTWTATALPAKTIPAGGYFLIQLYTGTGGLPLPAADATGGTNLSALSGKVALVSTATALTCTTKCGTAAGVIDFVGYGAATDYEGTGPAPPATVITSAQRKASGCTETDDNGNDFASAAPSPRNAASTKVDCMIDAGADTAPIDTGPLDTGPLDTGTPDTSTPDTSMPDTSMPDTSMPDTSMPDTSMPDTSTPDTVVASDSATEETTATDSMIVEDTAVDDTALPAQDSALVAFDLPAAKPACSCSTPGQRSTEGLGVAGWLVALGLLRGGARRSRSCRHP
jgi:hypothetical protein